MSHLTVVHSGPITGTGHLPAYIDITYQHSPVLSGLVAEGMELLEVEGYFEIIFGKRPFQTVVSGTHIEIFVAETVLEVARVAKEAVQRTEQQIAAQLAAQQAANERRRRAKERIPAMLVDGLHALAALSDHPPEYLAEINDLIAQIQK